MLEQVVTDPSGGVWAVGLHYDRRMVVGEGGAKLLSSFILHDEGGAWVKRYELPGSFTGMDTLAIVSPTEGWLLGQSRSHGLVVHYTGGSDPQTGGTPQAITYVAMVSVNEGWAVRSKGSILHLVGGSWGVVPSPTSAQLRGLAMVSTMDGWAVGDHGTILHYTGGSWSEVTTPTDNFLYSVAMASPEDGWAAGEGGIILHYTGGKWTEVQSPTGAFLDVVTMVSPEEGWAVGDDFDHYAIILHYTAGAWQKVASPTDQPLVSVTGTSAHDVWAVGVGGTILHYTGAAWSVVNAPS